MKLKSFMKRFIFAIAVVFSAVSCFEDGSTVINDTLFTTFDYSYVSDSYAKDSVYVEGPFGWSNLLIFSNKVVKENEKFKEFKGGFALSCLSGDVPVPEKDDAEAKSGEGVDVTDDGSGAEEPAVINPFRVYAPMGTKNNYAVFFQTDDMPEHDVVFGASSVGTCTMTACYVNNTVEVVDFVKRNFVVGDRITLRAKGSLGGNPTGTAEINLADYSAREDSVVTAWTLFDLKKLGSVDAVDFEIISSKDAPKVFCLDVMVASVTLTY